MLKPTNIKAAIPVIYLKEGETFICYSPAFDLTAHGDSFEDAERSFAHTLKLFVEQVSKKGTWHEVLEEHGCRLSFSSARGRSPGLGSRRSPSPGDRSNQKRLTGFRDQKQPSNVTDQHRRIP